MLYNAHGVPKRKEPIPLLHRFLVGVQHMLAPSKRGYQHDEGALRKMEICDQAVHGLEGVTRIDENIRPSGLGLEGAVVVYQGFQGAAGGRAYADDAPAVSLRFVQHVRGFGAHHAQLRVHMMLSHFLRLYRAEGAEPYVQLSLIHI